MAIPHEALALRDRWTRRVGEVEDHWPARTWRDVCAAGITGWTIPERYGGSALSPGDQLEGCLELARGDLLVAFILSQFFAACQRLGPAAPEELKQRWLPELAAGKSLATVGISHLTTSRQHTAPAVAAIADGSNWRLSGQVPWVTACRHADLYVVGGTLADGRQLLAAIPADAPGFVPGPPLPLLALTGSETGPVELQDVVVSRAELIAGPVMNVMQQSGIGGTGSFMTSALALGHALRCLDHLQEEARDRPALQPVVQSLQDDADQIRLDLLAAVNPQTVSPRTAEQLRIAATDLALRCSQAYLTATKGAGFLADHPAARLVREAMFFLVWSCPQSVASHLLHSFAGCDLK